MLTKLMSRGLPAGNAAMSRPAVYAARVLITSYFLLIATGMVKDPVIGALFNGYAGEPAIRFVLSASVIIAGLMVMMDRFVRQAALFLAVFVLYSAALHYGQNWVPGAVGAIWREATLMAALVMIAFGVTSRDDGTQHDADSGVNATPGTTLPAFPRTVALTPAVTRRPKGDVIVPRRIRPVAAAPQERAPRPDPQHITPKAEVILPAMPDEDAEDTNIFGDVWDKSEQRTRVA